MFWLSALGACNSGSAGPGPRSEPVTAQAPASPAQPAQGSAAAPGPTQAPAQVAASTDATYQRLCAPCHAADATGYSADHAPSLVNPTFLESASDEFLRRSIIWGRPGTSMGAYGKALGGPLQDAEVEQLVAYLRAKGPQARPLAKVGIGDAARGAPLYDQNCKSCHGDAKVRGEAPHLANAQFLMIASDPFIKHALVAGRPGTKMPAFASQLSDGQLDDVVAYVRQLGAGGPKDQLLPEPTGKEPLVIHPKGKASAWQPRDGRFVGVDDVAKALADKRRMVIIDARPPSDWRRAHVQGAVSIPYHDLKRLDEIPKDVAVVAYCACPHHLSGIVVDELIKRGHKKAYVLDEGINVWHQRGYPITAAEGVQPPALDPHAGHGH